MEQEWISLNEFMRRNKMGYSTAKKMMSEGRLEYQKIGVQYKIKVSKNEQVNEENQRLIQRVAELETYVKTIQSAVNQIKVQEGA